MDDALLLDWAAFDAVGFPVMNDALGHYRSLEQTQATAPFPLDVLIDREGNIAYISTHYDPDAIEAVLEGL